MALVLPLILSLYFALLQEARMNGARLEVTCAADASTDAVMAEFSAALFSRYDLFFIDTAYGTGSPSDAALESRLNYYFQKKIGNYFLYYLILFFHLDLAWFHLILYIQN